MAGLRADMMAPFSPLIAIKQQLEYYLSDRNLDNDKYLLQQMDGDGVVDASIFITFPRMRKLFQHSNIHSDQEKLQMIRNSISS